MKEPLYVDDGIYAFKCDKCSQEFWFGDTQRDPKEDPMLCFRCKEKLVRYPVPKICTEAQIPFVMRQK